jgi:hypothetical protein
LEQYWNKSELDLLRSNYSTHSKVGLIELFPNRTYQAIQRMASNLGVKRVREDYVPTLESRAKMSKSHLGVKLSEAHRAALRRCTLDEMAFDVLTEHAIYWIGFLMADGNISYKKGIPIIALHLKAVDLPHLLKFREFIGSSHTVSNYINKLSGNTICSISFASERLSNVLDKYGFVRRKCFTAQVKGGVQHSRHLWRGVIDGDGCLGVYQRKCLNGSVRRIPYINITGSRHMCSQFKTFLEKEIGEPMPPKLVFYRNSYGYMISDRRAVKAIKLLYHGSTIALDQKLRKALDMIDEYGIGHRSDDCSTSNSEPG